MNQADALDITQLAMWTLIVASSPAVVAAMVVGLAIALLQFLTHSFIRTYTSAESVRSFIQSI